MGHAKPGGIPAVGSQAPDFRLRNLAGGHSSLGDLVAKGPVLLAFFKVSCPVCQLTFPFLERIHREGEPGSMSICGIAQDEADWARDFNRRYGVTFPTLLDTQAGHYAASNAYGISSVPTLFLIDRGGAVAWALEGFSRRDIQALAGRAAVNPFRPGEYVPEWKAG